jgi:hypothetical protein
LFVVVKNITFVSKIAGPILYISIIEMCSTEFEFHIFGCSSESSDAPIIPVRKPSQKQDDSLWKVSTAETKILNTVFFGL